VALRAPRSLALRLLRRARLALLRPLPRPAGASSRAALRPLRRSHCLAGRSLPRVRREEARLRVGPCGSRLRRSCPRLRTGLEGARSPPALDSGR
jgi:hypothetical protein